LEKVLVGSIDVFDNQTAASKSDWQQDGWWGFSSWQMQRFFSF